MAPTELQALCDQLAAEEAKMLEIRRNPSRHLELKSQQDAVKRARSELQAYETTHESG